MPQIVRPSAAAFKRALALSIVAFALIGFSVLLQAIRNPAIGLAYVALLGLTALGYVLYFRNARIEYGDGLYRVRSLIGTVREFTTDDIERVVTVNALVANALTNNPASALPQLFVRGAGDTKLLRLNGATWDVTQLAALAQDMIARGEQHQAFPAPITPAHLDAQAPGLLSWVEVHRVAFALIVGGAAIVLVIIVAVMVAAILISSAF